MPVQVKHVSWKQGRKQLKALRTKVFICEYHIPPSVEFDKADYEAHHILLLDIDETPVATARIANNGRISRVAIATHHRNQAINTQLIDAIKALAVKLGLARVSFNCELTDINKFAQPRYQRTGGVFMEAGIPRQTLACDTD
ncbi:MAG: putative GNAT family N-acyltransferase, partial [Alteromonadaceae bacterium]